MRKLTLPVLDQWMKSQLNNIFKNNYINNGVYCVCTCNNDAIYYEHGKHLHFIAHMSQHMHRVCVESESA